MVSAYEDSLSPCPLSRARSLVSVDLLLALGEGKRGCALCSLSLALCICFYFFCHILIANETFPSRRLVIATASFPVTHLMGGAGDVAAGSAARVG